MDHPVESPIVSADSPMMRERERARRLATQVVALALALAGVMLVVLAIVLIVRGGPALILLAIIVGILGLALGLVGFFFQLVPIRIDELAQEKREYDARQRQR